MSTGVVVIVYSDKDGPAVLAAVQAAKRLTRSQHRSSGLAYVNCNETLAPEISGADRATLSALEVDELDLPQIAIDHLKNANIGTLGHLSGQTIQGLRAIPGISNRMIDRIKELLAAYEMQLDHT